MKERLFLSLLPFFAPEGAGQGAGLVYEDDLDVPAGAKATSEMDARSLRTNRPPIDDINKFSIVQGIPLQEIGRIICSALTARNQESFLDRESLARGVKRHLISLYIDDTKKNWQPLKDIGDKYGKIPEICQNWTIGELIARQFQKSTKMVKALNVRAEFFHKKIKTPAGFAICRLFQYNTGGFVTCEYRAYDKTVDAGDPFTSPATPTNNGKAPEYDDLDYSVESASDDLEVKETPKQPTGKGKVQL